MNRLAKIVVALAIAASLMAFAAPPAAPAQAGTAQTYIVLYKQKAVPANAGSVIAEAGGALIYRYEKIGVAIVRSDSASFRDEILRDKKVMGATSTAGFVVPLGDGLTAIDAADAPASNDDPLANEQWDMRQIHVPEAHAITTGSPAVVVGDIDSGVDYNHPDLAANIDFERSVSCIGGVPNPDPAAWEDNNGHGTHTAGTIAAAKNGVGIVGVAPDVKIAAIKGCTDAGYCWPEDIVCSFMWAAEHQIDVTNNSYYVDPYEFNCHNDPEQRAIWKAIHRAVRYAQSQGVTVVTSAGNSNIDLAHPGGGITNACDDLPVELAGVIGVSANGNLLQKSYYSSHGVGAVDVVAPGGDAYFQRTDEAPNGRVLSTIPTKFGSYGWGQGTSMASPHVAGVAALIISQYGKMMPGRVQAHITQTADPQECPPNPFVPGGYTSLTAYCQGGRGYNSFYGHGQVNAFNAVTHRPGR
jgi:subtilisin family serine protease